MKRRTFALIALALALVTALFPALMPETSATIYQQPYTGPMPEEIINSGSCPEDAARTENGGRHQWLLMDWIQPFCTEPGKAYYNCAYCDEFQEMEFTGALGHDWGEWVTPPGTREGV